MSSPPDKDYWAPVKEAWNLYTKAEQRFMVLAWTVGLVVAILLVRAI